VALCGLSHSIHVRYILRPSGCNLVGDQVFRGNHEHLEAGSAVHDFLGAPLPRGIKVDAGAWTATAYPPTMRYLTRYSLNSNKSSLKSSLNIADGLLPVKLHERKLAGSVDPFTDGAALPVTIFFSLHLIEVRELTDGLVHAPFVVYAGGRGKSL